MLDKSFDPSKYEARLYKEWEDAGLFKADPAQGGEAFIIMFPPPNVTGSLHFGHALNFALQDIIIRAKRMEGCNVLWQAGTDHAGIATQLVVEKALAAEGLSRTALGREAFLRRVWDWKEASGGTIVSQLRQLGASADWTRERFTMDDGLSRAVREVFVTLYEQKLIYRDRRLVNWDPVFGTAISDLEIENRDVNGSMWHIAYPLKNGGQITVATTRPETMLADMAVAVHPDDTRYREMIGQTVILPLVGREIPIVADTYSDPEKGTGAVKITPAHDFNDFAVGRRHDLAMPSIFDACAAVTLEEIAGDLRDVPDISDTAFVRKLEGVDRVEARKWIVEKLEEMGFLIKQEPHRLSMPHAQRGGAVVEPRLTTQWFCDAETLAKPAIQAVENKAVKFEPQQWENTFFAWMRDIQPWCISRQLWWGHRIPAWYGPDGAVFVAHDDVGACRKARAHYGRDVALTQDEDVLDTWFSSALWPFSTLGWPEQTAELARYYPTSVLLTGFDIIFFWVARMMVMGLHFTGKVPFETVVIHGLVRDEHGQKMSKSKGNGLDPLELIAEYGADATRMAICALAGPGRNIRFGRKRVEDYRSFITKLWNAARFCEMNGVKADPAFDPAAVRTSVAKWLLSEAHAALGAAQQALSHYRFDEYAGQAYRFVWNIFCDWFLEFAKPFFTGEDDVARKEIQGVASYVLGRILTILHPVIPFVTSVLWENLGHQNALPSEAWPEWSEKAQSDPAIEEVRWMIALISEIRALRAEMNVPAGQKITVFLQEADAGMSTRIEAWRPVIERMARLATIDMLDGAPPASAALSVLQGATLVMPLEGLIDIVAEKNRVGQEIEKARRELEKVEKKLANAAFIERAKPEVVEENRARAASFADDIARLEKAVARLNAIN